MRVCVRACARAFNIHSKGQNNNIYIITEKVFKHDDIEKLILYTT